ncbi:MAG: metallophosphatase family protein [Pelagimonas sp.]|jgi:predicted phosphodiesterase|nr:metallophosphatase family protein [Pelagimonas sp.]
MRIAEFERRDGPLAIIGGPYSNAHALSAALEQISARGIAPDHIICTGDVVGYCALPDPVVEQVRALQTQGMVVIAGNVEQQLANDALDCGCGFDEGSTCDLLSAGWYGFANQAVGQDNRDWMKTLPDIALFETQGQRVAVLHGAASDVSRFLWPTTPDDVLQYEINLLQGMVGTVDVVISGHSGLVFDRQIRAVRWINGGVIGMPPNDGQPQTRVAYWDGGQSEFAPLEYDVAGAVEAMEKAGLTQGYHRALTTGWWPSEDVLPPELRRSV